jgi:hypothetical protein
MLDLSLREDRQRWKIHISGRLKGVEEQSLRTDDRTTHIVWVILTENEVPRVLVDRVADVKIPEKRSTQKARDISIVHAVCYTVAYQHEMSPAPEVTHLSHIHRLQRHKPAHKLDLE